MPIYSGFNNFSILTVKPYELPMLDCEHIRHLQHLYLKHGDYVQWNTLSVSPVTPSQHTDAGIWKLPSSQYNMTPHYQEIDDAVIWQFAQQLVSRWIDQNTHKTM